MVHSWRTPPSSSPSSEHQHREIDPSSSSSSNFDPIKEWLIDLEHLDPLMTSDSDLPNHFDPGNFELRGHKDSTLVEAFIDHKMEQVSLADPNLDPNDAGCNRTEVVEATADVGNDTVTVCNGVVAGEEKNDAIHEICAVNDPIIAANESDEGESSDESEECGDSSSKGLSTSSSSSSSSSDEEEESSSSEEEDDSNEMKEEELAVEVEDGEICGDELDEATFGSDGEEAVPKGPIKSKHEIEDLPPVPPLEVSLEPHHQTLPVGIVSSIMGNRVIVEGSEKHSPLNEGSVLWITETRFPLGRIDEIFGPVKNPYYIVRYNSDKEVPQGVNVGGAISFVADFANHILDEKKLYEKGYDASGADEEEANEVEFSDDEKEAEYRKSLRQKKRDTTQQVVGNNQESGGFCKKNSSSNFKGSRFHQKDKQLQSPHSRANIGRNNFNCASSSTTLAQQLNSTQPQQSPLSIASSSTTLVHGFPSQQLNTLQGQGGFPPGPQSMGMQSGFSPQAQMMAMQPNWMAAQHQNQSLMNNFVNGIMQYQQQQQQQFVPGNLGWFGGASNPSVDLSMALLGLMAQGGGFNQSPLGCGNVNQSGPVVRNQGEPGHTDNGQSGFGQVPSRWDPQRSLANDQNHGSNPNGQASGVNGESGMRSPNVQFKQGRSSSSRGKRPYGRGGGRPSFGRRGGGRQSYG